MVLRNWINNAENLGAKKKKKKKKIKTVREVWFKCRANKSSLLNEINWFITEVWGFTVVNIFSF